MDPTGLRRIVAACALALTLGGLTGCGDEQGVDEPAREGLAIDVAGVDYNVFLTRELNLAITPDKAYYRGPAAKPGRALYGVFLQACNLGDEPKMTTDDFVVEDNQGTRFRPVKLPRVNSFAYNKAVLGKDDCIPQAGSVAQQGPVAGSMLLFDFPLAATENRPLELVIRGPYDLLEGKRDTKRVELDL